MSSNYRRGNRPSSAAVTPSGAAAAAVTPSGAAAAAAAPADLPVDINCDEPGSSSAAVTPSGGAAAAAVAVVAPAVFWDEPSVTHAVSEWGSGWGPDEDYVLEDDVVGSKRKAMSSSDEIVVQSCSSKQLNNATAVIRAAAKSDEDSERKEKLKHDLLKVLSPVKYLPGLGSEGNLNNFYTRRQSLKERNITLVNIQYLLLNFNPSNTLDDLSIEGPIFLGVVISNAYHARSTLLKSAKISESKGDFEAFKSNGDEYIKPPLSALLLGKPVKAKIVDQFRQYKDLMPLWDKCLLTCTTLDHNVVFAQSYDTTQYSLTRLVQLVNSLVDQLRERLPQCTHPADNSNEVMSFQVEVEDIFITNNKELEFVSALKDAHDMKRQEWIVKNSAISNNK
jgi:hypothetical protein